MHGPHFALLTTCWLPTACTNTAPEDNWEFEGPNAGKWQSLDGPPGGSHIYSGRLDQYRFFSVGRHVDEAPLFEKYKPGRGSTTATALHRATVEVQTTSLQSVDSIRPQLISTDDYHYFAHSNFVDEFVYLRKSPQGGYWERFAPPDTVEKIGGHGSHGGDLDDGPVMSGTQTGPPPVLSMTVHDHTVWVVTRHQGDWRAPIETGDWQSAHARMPTNGDRAQPVARLVSLDAGLFALAKDAIYRRGPETWQHFTSEQFSEDWTFEKPLHQGVDDLVEFRGRLIVATHEALYFLDDETGEYELFWRPERSPIETMRALPSGLYVGLRNAGVWWFGPSH